MAFDQNRFKKIKAADTKTISRFTERDNLNDVFEKMYWIEDKAKAPTGWADTDVRYTKDPSARDEVIGMHRLLKTAAPQFKVTCENKAYANQIEKALDVWWKASSEVKRAKVESDLYLSAILFADVGLTVSEVDDLLEIKGIPQAQKNRLTDIRRRTPFLFEASASQMCYPTFGEYGLTAYLRRYKATGDAIRIRWGVEDLEEEKDYTVRDHYDLEWRCVYIEEKADTPIILDTHGLPYIPVAASVADGTEIFAAEEKKRQPFLYGRYKSGLNDRADELLTTLFTSVYGRGTGPLFAIDPTGLTDNTVQVNYAGIFRYIIGKATTLNDKAYDADLLQLKNILDDMGAQSTIYKQTLGQNVGGQTPFSTVAMLSQSGRLPTIPPNEAVAKVIKEAALIALKLFREAGRDWNELKPSMILDDVDIDVTLEVKLPQDTFRNAQVAAQLQNIVSKEWIRQNLLQIGDSDAMDEIILSENANTAAFQQLLPEIIKEIFQMFGVGGPAKVGGGDAQIPPPQDEGMTDGTNPAALQAGGEAMPMTDPMQV